MGSTGLICAKEIWVDEDVNRLQKNQSGDNKEQISFSKDQ